MAARDRIAASVRDVLVGCWPHRFDGVELRDDVSLGEGGLGLDSIEIVEFLFACEERLDGRATEELLTAGPIRLGQLADHFASP